METTTMFVIAAGACAFLCGCIGLLQVGEYLQAQAYRKRMAGAAGATEGSWGGLVRNGFLPLVGLAQAAGKWKLVGQWFAKLAEFARKKGATTTPDRVGSVVLLVLLATCTLASLVISPVFGLACSACMVLGFNAVVAAAEERTHQAMRDAIPSALQALRACFLAGYSLEQALSQVAREVEGPLAEVFAGACSVYEAGGTVEQSLEHLKAATNEPEMVFLATALEIQHRTGSSIQSVLAVAQESVEDEIALKRSLRTQTAQAKLSARIVTAMPFVLIGVFSLTSEGFLQPFFESIAGMATLGVALGMQIAGIVLVRRMLNVEVL